MTESFKKVLVEKESCGGEESDCGIECDFTAFRYLFSCKEAQMVGVNERVTEDFVRDHFKKYIGERKDIFLEEQKSENPRVQRLLKGASKKGGTGFGQPEFIITFADEPDFIILIECKPDEKKHISKNKENYVEYAVDGVLLYSSFVSKSFDVLSIAVSGMKKKDARVDTFLQLRGELSARDLRIKELYDFESYLGVYKQDEKKEKQETENLLVYSRDLNNTLRDKFEVEEGHRPLLVSGILLALEDESFMASYKKKKKPVELAKLLINTISERLDHDKIGTKKSRSILSVYNFIKTEVKITEEKSDGKKNTKLRDLIEEISEKVLPFKDHYRHFDILGQFYNEFLRYANGDGGLGIVLTPRHITNLFVKLANVDKNSIVMDNCCGTAGFLISAMKLMEESASGKIKKIGLIHKKQLIGIESNAKMFCLACSNMMLRGDGKSNIHYQSCFDINKKSISSLKPNVGLLNPPYSKKVAEYAELNYILNCLSFLQKGGICIAILPISCAIEPSKYKRKLLENHTLEAVMSMPIDLFHPTSTVTCIMVFKAKHPHPKGYESWFGYWRDDGFMKVRKFGRIDKEEKWKQICDGWLDDFKNKRRKKGKSLRKAVKWDDEWCAEAYLKTNYAEVDEATVLKKINEYIIYNIVNGE